MGQVGGMGEKGLVLGGAGTIEIQKKRGKKEGDREVNLRCGIGGGGELDVV